MSEGNKWEKKCRAGYKTLSMSLGVRGEEKGHIFNKMVQGGLSKRDTSE